MADAISRPAWQFRLHGRAGCTLDFALGRRRSGILAGFASPFGESIMFLARREALRQLSALLAIPLVRWPERLADPLAGTIAEFQAGRARGDWTAAHVTRQALDRATAWNRLLRAIDQFSETA